VGTKIRICATIPHTKGLESWGAVHEEMFAEIAREGLEIVMVDLPDVSVNTVTSRHAADIVAAAHTRAALRAEEEGFDAVAMGCLREPGVAAAKEMCHIPVVGAAQASMHMAALVARRFSFVGPGSPDGIEKYDLARYYGFSDYLASTRGIGAVSLSFAAGEEGLAELMVKESRLAIEEDGAQAIIGYGGLSVIRAMREALPVPVIDPVTAGILVAEMLARAKLT
jgi:allantoin racemase